MRPIPNRNPTDRNAERPSSLISSRGWAAPVMLICRGQHVVGMRAYGMCLCVVGGVQGHMVLTKEEQRIVSRGKKKAAAAIECIRALSAKMTRKKDTPIHNDQRKHEEHEEHEEHEMCGSAPSSSASRSASAVSSTGERGRAGAAANSERTKQTSWRGGQ